MSLVKSGKLTKLCYNKHPVLFTAIRNHWNKDYKPKAYPQTQEERKAAAAKYGLVPSEYVPYPDNGAGIGDYPKLPDISADSKDPFYPWDNPELKRNFNEPVHADADLMGEDRYDVSVRHRIPGWLQWTQFLGVMFGTFAIYIVLENCKSFPGLVPKQYPLEGKTHYSFESN